MSDGPVPSELEAKLLVANPQQLRAIGRLPQLGPYPLRRRDVVRLHSVYLDTPDHILARHRIAFRLRRQARHWEATVKWAGAARGLLHERPELTVPLPKAPQFPFALPEGPLRLHLCALVAGRPLQPVLVTDVRRRRIDVLPVDEAAGAGPVAELALDRVHLHSPDGAREEMYLEAEIERTAGERRDLTTLARLLRRTFTLAPSQDSKYVRGLTLVHGAVPLAADAPPVLGHEGVEQAARKIVARNLRRLRQNDPGTRLGEDPEALHDMRVATRRLRAVVRAFAPGVPRRLHGVFTEELRWLGSLLGSVRDLDVQLVNLASFGTAAPPGHRAGLDEFRAYLERERNARRVEMLAGLESERYFTLLQQLEAFAYGPARRRPEAAAREPIGLVGRRAIKKAFKRLLRRGGAIQSAPAPEDLHALRIRAKRLRYLLEFLRELTGKPGRRLVKQLVQLQDLLGAYHDAVVAADFVRLYVEGPGREVGPSTLLALGALVGSDMRLAEHTRSSFRRTWQRFTRKRILAELRAVLEQLQASAADHGPIRAPRAAGSGGPS
jgi:triphosphatase